MHNARVLDILERFQVKPIFFVIGRHLREQGALVTAAARAGHVISNHTHSVCHPARENAAALIQGRFCGQILWIDKTSGAVLRCKMGEFHRDRWSLEFRNLKTNPPLTDDDLQIRIPPSVRVLEQSLP